MGKAAEKISPHTSSAVQDLGPGEFARLLGIAPQRLPEGCRKLVADLDFRYRIIDTSEHIQTLHEVAGRISAEDFPVSGAKRKQDWEKGWSENLESFIAGGYDPANLVPKYVRPGAIKRLNGRYIRPLDPCFELNFYTVYRHYLFSAYFADCPAIYEFGCGTGYNLVILNQLFPEKELHGLDWSAASRTLVDKIGESRGACIRGHLFDMFAPDTSLEVPPGSAFITLNSMEQLGIRHEAFLQFILEKRPGICINAEPFVEFYDPADPLDALAINYHRKRGYLEGYYPRLRFLENEGRVEILTAHRIPFGSLFHEGYSPVIWRPR